MSTWTQAICWPCWDERHPTRTPVRLKAGHTQDERCSFCGDHTEDGIYVREDPATVPYPRVVPED